MAARSVLSNLARPARSTVDQSGVPEGQTHDEATGVTTGETIVLGRQPDEPAPKAETATKATSTTKK